jgi:hypothetical protein
MYRIIKFDILLKYIAIITVVISIVLYTIIQNYFFPNYSLFKIITISTIVSTAIVLLILSSYISRKIWAFLRFFNNALFPDLNGTWEGIITTENDEKIEVRSVIRQSLLITQIDMHGETMKSITLETTPTMEQGQQQLYYVYRATPKDPARSAYHGSTLFHIRQIEEENCKQLELSGHYYTDRKTIGRISLRQICTDPSKDVSFY